MDLRYTFNEDVMNYDKFRPRYCESLFKDIIEVAKLTDASKLLEIGIGTGQATEPFLKLNYRVHAIDIGANFLTFTQSKFQMYPNFTSELSEFEQFKSTENAFDLIYCATAFHWIPEDIGYPKTFKLLKPGGTLALFWNRPTMQNNEPLHQDIQAVYERYFPKKHQIVSPSKINEKRLNFMKQYGFEEVEMRSYKGQREFNANNYINLLNTYSDHRSLSSDVKADFEQAMREVIVSHGDKLVIEDEMTLFLGKKGLNGGVY